MTEKENEQPQSAMNAIERVDVVVVGGGFAGLNAVKVLSSATGDSKVTITLIDRQNYHLFWPLLYQVAMAGLSPGDIATPLRAIFSHRKNVHVVLGEVVDVDVDIQQVLCADGRRYAYETLLVAAGFRYHYFGNDEWREHAFDMQGMEQALRIRRQVLRAYELAEQTEDPDERQAWMTFVIVGAGPTGVELAGSIAEMANRTLTEDFRNIRPAETKILLLEMVEQVLPPFPSDLAAKARASLEALGVTVRTKTKVTDLAPGLVRVETDGVPEEIRSHTVMWAAGIKAAPLSQTLHDKTGVELDRGGRIKVSNDLSIPGYENIFVAGDMVYLEQDGKPLPGLAPVAMQQGKHVANQILRQRRGQATLPFHYVDRGIMATIGRAAAVADVRGLHLTGFVAWVLWLFVHLMYLVGFRNRLLVFIQWAWNYITFRRGVRLIVEETNSE